MGRYRALSWEEIVVAERINLRIVLGPPDQLSPFPAGPKYLLVLYTLFLPQSFIDAECVLVASRLRGKASSFEADMNPVLHLTFCELVITTNP